MQMDDDNSWDENDGNGEGDEDDYFDDVVVYDEGLFCLIYKLLNLIFELKYWFCLMNSHLFIVIFC